MITQILTAAIFIGSAAWATSASAVPFNIAAQGDRQQTLSNGIVAESMRILEPGEDRAQRPPHPADFFFNLAGSDTQYHFGGLAPAGGNIRATDGLDRGSLGLDLTADAAPLGLPIASQSTASEPIRTESCLSLADLLQAPLGTHAAWPLTGFAFGSWLPAETGELAINTADVPDRPAPNPTPEPGVLSLFAIGLLGAYFAGRHFDRG